MCGFVGVIDGTGKKEHDLSAMLSLIRHRGPDEQREVRFDGGISIGFARLGIIDLTGGSQPMSDHGITIVCNGEIYNYRELREKLKAKGVSFQTSSDVEVLLKMYRCYGMEMLPEIQGMYGAVIVDEKKRAVYLLRDRLGIKPVYFSGKDDRWAFASEIKPLLTLPFISREINQSAVAEFLAYEYIHAPRTIFSDVKKVLPGHYMEISESGIKDVAYWDCAEIVEDASLNVDSAMRRSEELLQEAMDLHLRSDVPLGLFLSGGIDSGLLTALAAQSHVHVDTYTVRFENGEFDESGLAQLVADRYHTNHHCYTVKADDFKKLLPEMLWYFDEPLGDSGILPNYMLNQLVQENGTKVVLSGAGGDELFAGYGYYFANKKERIVNSAPHAAGVASTLLRKARPGLSEKLDRALLYRKDPFGHLIRCETVMEPDLTAKLLGVGIPVDGAKEQYYERYSNAHIPSVASLNGLLYTDIKTYLTDDLMLLSDRTAMAWSIEGRVPFLHHPLVEFAMSIPAEIKAPHGQRKWLLKKIAERYLPEELLHAPKMGFCSPIRQWEKTGLGEFAYEILNSPRCLDRTVWDTEGFRSFVGDKATYKQSFSKIYLLLVLELFFRIHVDSSFASAAEAVV